MASLFEETQADVRGDFRINTTNVTALTGPACLNRINYGDLNG
jgi:hypothetical protein